MLTAGCNCFRTVSDYRTDIVITVGGDTYSDTGTAEEDRRISLSERDRFGCRNGKVRIIIFRVHDKCPAIKNLLTEFFKECGTFIFCPEGAMIGTEGDRQLASGDLCVPFLY